MTASCIVAELKTSLDFFERSTRNLSEDDSTFSPADGMFTAAQQVAHVGQTVDWFVEGASRPEGFDLNFETHATQLAAVTSLEQAREWVRRAYSHAVSFFESKTPEQLAMPLPDGPVMGGQPIFSVISAISDHTAHHRGALSVYTRLRGKVPPMPYADM